MKITNY
ncbi:hypothetical protein ECEC4422_1791, partial [Escherichia coli EC4422]